MPWELIRNYEPDWSYTELEELEEVIKSNTQLAYKLVARRITSEGKQAQFFKPFGFLDKSGIPGVCKPGITSAFLMEMPLWRRKVPKLK